MGDTGETSDRKFTVKVDGEDKEVNEKELLDGYMRQADYTKKTQKLSDEGEYFEQLRRVDDFLQRNPDKAAKVQSIIEGREEPAVVKGTDDEGDDERIPKSLMKEIQGLKKDLDEERRSGKMDRMDRKIQTALKKYPKASYDVVLAVASLGNTRSSIEDIAQAEHERQETLIADAIAEATKTKAKEPEIKEPTGLGSRGVSPGYKVPDKTETNSVGRPLNIRDRIKAASDSLRASIKSSE